MARNTATTIESDEIAQFSRHADDWWNPDGKFRPLHRLNPLRVEYVRDQVCDHFKRSPNQKQALKGLKVLDVGCGGGLMAEPLARMGASVAGLDASKETIAVAQRHMKSSKLDIDYRVGSVEELARGKSRYDLITALEIAEHVADLDMFLEALHILLKPGGLLIMSTLNRTPQSFALGIVAAEYILGWVPRGTHQWKKFIRPSELASKLEAVKLDVRSMTGIVFNPLRNVFELRKGALGVNYIMTAGRS